MSLPPAYSSTAMADGIPTSEQKIHMQPPPLQSQPSDGQYPPRAAMVQPGMPQPAMPYQPAGPGTFMSQPQSIPGPQPQVVGDQYRAHLFAQCAQGIHDPHTKYGVCGIITAVVCFPIGLICLFTDREQRCHRCGIRLDGK
ncbi:hypothetical protein FB446DRAFT_254492 [Lentinula raphanica]|nr:hypothetical protein FB446DRAFT_254492 [Lentinula raphanica]